MESQPSDTHLSNPKSHHIAILFIIVGLFGTLLFLISYIKIQGLSQDLRESKQKTLEFAEKSLFATSVYERETYARVSKGYIGIGDTRQLSIDNWKVWQNIGLGLVVISALFFTVLFAVRSSNRT